MRGHRKSRKWKAESRNQKFVVPSQWSLVLGLWSVVRGPWSYEGGFECCDDGVLVGFGQKRMHGETEDFAGGFFGFWEVAPFISAGGEDGLLVEALGVINGGGDAAGFELFGDLVTVGDADSVLGVNVGVAGRNRRRL